MNDAVFDLLTYIDASPTPYHAVRETVARLRTAGFAALDERDAWRVEPGERRYVIRDDGSVAAFIMGARPVAEAGLHIIGAHTDSPGLRLKPQPRLSQHGYEQLAVEPYGGVLLYTWLDRELSVAGRVAVREGERARTILIDLERPMLVVPSLAIHLQREIHETGLKLNAQNHLPPILGMTLESDFARILADAVGKSLGRGVAEADVLSFELMTYDVRPAAIGGAEDDLLFAPRLDNLASCHAAMTALIARANEDRVEQTRAIVFYDHEEVGSRSAQGAGGTLLVELIERLSDAGSGGAEGRARAVRRSMLVSADMAHAVHPNFADRHDPSHRPVIGRGPVIKHNANLAYASGAETTAAIVQLCRRRGVTPQHFVIRSDLPCGSTIGPITAARVGIPTVDIGSPMLAMHSCRETAGAADVQPMIDLMGDFLLTQELL